MKQSSVKKQLALWIMGACLSTGTIPAYSATAAPTLTYSWPTNAGPLDPRGYSPNQMYAQAMVYEPLVRYTAEGTLEPWLATHWSVSPDGKTYTFTLRDHVQFSDGSPFNAAAAKANLDAVLANAKRHQWMELVSTLERVEAPDEHTLVLHLKHPYYPTLMELAQVRPLRFAAPDAKPGTSVGTGPWVLAQTRRGEYDRFERNEHYWGAKPAYGAVLVKVISDPDSRAIALQTGELDLIQGAEGEISPGTFVRLRDAGFKTAISAPLATRTVAMNTGQAPTNELVVRQAINQAVDKDTIIAKVLHGLEPRADALFSSNMPYANIGLKALPYDPDHARQALDAAGWKIPAGKTVRVKDGQPLSTELVFLGTSALQKSLAEIIQGELAKVGIEIKLRAEEEGSLVQRQREGRFGMIFADTWGAPYDPHSFVSSMRYPGHADYMAQRGLPMKDQIDHTIAEVLGQTDESKRAEGYREILTTLHDQAVYLPVSYLTAISVSAKGVDNVQFGSTLFDVPFEAMRPATGKP
ncbi:MULTISPECIES: nickel ABC transporter substrate-binding protein [unclassified Pseudomonas]|uniref:nickel ABC transporter substrate-binding protein n=1 Tax=unclassified Pseudomonas TaxID=196821 RepID=UPI0013230402|nr:nickel ABC transporter, nickel/metallophore periplasmic binding protein [Pseudomonas sp. FSL R10-0765]MQT50742.1 nickel ABC transporter, nickel/metallophore periplasmic binding protein [Pseudomonas sp. FSL R10-2398]MQU00611.1 nickel ABC transporter, nickel/metallophore periplasmic binding protein [Pseudomonas sp. FSL R10-2245]MQU10438.1 nickel ABC transporter, nickel/metallophore periplasmic binding protein [Pseudomonas sp. FSL R10-2189]MQU35769.1 nickel ABC transporter, nickel/metallophore 